ncbi:CHMP7 isoform 9 [Pan troglodytes]|uniref:CHMP7 isoform 9 n=1 Tax=Pan troglodytes TaxID=9598 RepID=A0A2J8N8Z2_PANTR|nr:CHMP7 isoform 9 [Pan troglodytes]
MWSPEREAEAPTGGDPAGLLPPEWEEDEERMSFLFSAFKRSREVNSTDWDSKMGFWAPLVLSHSRRQGVVRLRLRDLQEAFQRKGSVPLGLATVLQDLLRKRLRRCIVCIRTRPSPPTLWWPCQSSAPSVLTPAQMRGPSTWCCCSCRRRRGSQSSSRTGRRL